MVAITERAFEVLPKHPLLSRAASAAGPRRVHVDGVIASSPAARGFQIGDIIEKVNGRPLESYLHLHRQISLLAPGTIVHLSVVREGEVHAVDASVAEKPP